jgi:hypothetical protein
MLVAWAVKMYVFFMGSPVTFWGRSKKKLVKPAGLSDDSISYQSNHHSLQRVVFREKIFPLLDNARKWRAHHQEGREFFRRPTKYSSVRVKLRVVKCLKQPGM